MTDPAIRVVDSPTPSEVKQEGADSPTALNPEVEKQLDVSLMYTLTHDSPVCCVRFSADGKYLATGSNRAAQIFDTETGQKICVLIHESAQEGDVYVRSVCFSPDGNLLVTGAEDKQIRLWNIPRRQIRNIFDNHRQEIFSLDFSSDGRFLVSGSGDRTVMIFDMVDGTHKVLTINDSSKMDPGVMSVAISPNAQYVAAGSLNTEVWIWDVATGMQVDRLRGHEGSVYSVAFTPDGKGLVSGSLDKTLKYWDVSALGAPVKKEADEKGDEKGSVCTMNFTGHKDYVLSVAITPDGQSIISGSKDGVVQFWDAHKATVQYVLRAHTRSVLSIDMSAAGGILATGSSTLQAKIWRYSRA